MPALRKRSTIAPLLCIAFVLPAFAAAQIVNPANGHLYTLTSGAVDVQTARAEAQALGGYLVSIADASENAFVLSSFAGIGINLVWIGCSDEQSEGVWQWDSGEPFLYANWGVGEPNNSAGGENWAWMNLGGPIGGVPGTWNDIDANAASFGPPHGVIEIPGIVALLGSCAIGNVGQGAGGLFTSLLVNGSSGSSLHRVDAPINSPITITVLQPPTNPLPAPFIVFGLIGTPSSTDSVTLPFNLGSMCFTPFTANPNFPGAFILANSYYPGDPDALLPSTPAPWNYTKVTGIHFPFQFTLQGLISQDPATVRVTNGVILNIQ